MRDSMRFTGSSYVSRVDIGASTVESVPRAVFCTGPFVLSKCNATGFFVCICEGPCYMSGANLRAVGA